MDKNYVVEDESRPSGHEGVEVEQVACLFFLNEPQEASSVILIQLIHTEHFHIFWEDVLHLKVLRQKHLIRNEIPVRLSGTHTFVSSPRDLRIRFLYLKYTWRPKSTCCMYKVIPKQVWLESMLCTELQILYISYACTGVRYIIFPTSSMRST